MNLLGRVAQLGVPAPVRKVLLTRLFTDTAAAFGRPVPQLRGLSFQQVLQAFRQFTAQTATEESASSPISQRLFDVSYRRGSWLRRAFGVVSTDDAMAAARVVYRCIGIDFEGHRHGEITIRGCFFSPFYTPQACNVMSALDAGLLAGLSDGGRLVFSQRITEGYPCCRARLDRAEAVI